MESRGDSDNIPIPLASILPLIVSGQVAISLRISRVMYVWSSETKRAPNPMSFKDKLDFPDPADPRIKTPVPSIETQLACRSFWSG